jgi:predicted amidohydrolase YtcJ
MAETTIDLDDAFVIPAFLEGHAHPIFAGLQMYIKRLMFKNF